MGRLSRNSDRISSSAIFAIGSSIFAAAFQTIANHSAMHGSVKKLWPCAPQTPYGSQYWRIEGCCVPDCPQFESIAGITHRPREEAAMIISSQCSTLARFMKEKA